MLKDILTALLSIESAGVQTVNTTFSTTLKPINLAGFHQEYASTVNAFQPETISRIYMRQYQGSDTKGLMSLSVLAPIYSQDDVQTVMDGEAPDSMEFPMPHNATVAVKSKMVQSYKLKDTRTLWFSYNRWREGWYVTEVTVHWD